MNFTPCESPHRPDDQYLQVPLTFKADSSRNQKRHVRTFKNRAAFYCTAVIFHNLRGASRAADARSNINERRKFNELGHHAHENALANALSMLQDARVSRRELDRAANIFSPLWTWRFECLSWSAGCLFYYRHFVERRLVVSRLCIVGRFIWRMKKRKEIAACFARKMIFRKDKCRMGQKFLFLLMKMAPSNLKIYYINVW